MGYRLIRYNSAVQYFTTRYQHTSLIGFNKASVVLTEVRFDSAHVQCTVSQKGSVRRVRAVSCVLTQLR